MQPEREHNQRILRAKLAELAELISVLTAVGYKDSAQSVYQESVRVADRLARLQEGRRDE